MKWATKTSMVLLGAGCSVDAGLPTAVGLTNQVLEIFKNTRKNFKALSFVVGGLELGRGLRGETLIGGVNSEDLYTATEMLANRHALQISPFVGQWIPFMEQVEYSGVKRFAYSSEYRRTQSLDRIARIITGFPKQNPAWGNDRESAREFVAELENLFRKRVSSIFAETAKDILGTLNNLLWLKPDHDVAYLHPLVKRCAENRVPVATLNYDNTIEVACQQAGIRYEVGVDTWKSKRRFVKPHDGVELLKLHGSIDWRIVRSKPASDAPMQIDDIEILSSGTWNRQPALIFGAGNKLTANGPFLDLFNAFTSRLERSSRLVVIGYSFSDEHINATIAKWINRDKRRKLLLIEGPGSTPWSEYEQTLTSFRKSLQGLVNKRCEVKRVGAKEGIADGFM